MRVEDIPIFPEVRGPSNFIHNNRYRAPEYLRTLIEQLEGIEGLKSLRELAAGDIKPLLGGEDVDGVRDPGGWALGRGEISVPRRAGGGGGAGRLDQHWSQGGRAH